MVDVTVFDIIEYEYQKKALKEERMIRYAHECLEDGWEVKILRSTLGAKKYPRQQIQISLRSLDIFTNYTLLKNRRVKTCQKMSNGNIE